MTCQLRNVKRDPGWRLEVFSWGGRPYLRCAVKRVNRRPARPGTLATHGSVTGGFGVDEAVAAGQPGQVSGGAPAHRLRAERRQDHGIPPGPQLGAISRQPAQRSWQRSHGRRRRVDPGVPTGAHTSVPTESSASINTIGVSFPGSPRGAQRTVVDCGRGQL